MQKNNQGITTIRIREGMDEELLHHGGKCSGGCMPIYKNKYEGKEFRFYLPPIKHENYHCGGLVYKMVDKDAGCCEHQLYLD